MIIQKMKYYLKKKNNIYYRITTGFKILGIKLFKYMSRNNSQIFKKLKKLWILINPKLKNYLNKLIIKKPDLRYFLKSIIKKRNIEILIDTF